MADGPDCSMIEFHLAAISSTASSHPMEANLPSPLAPIRRRGVAIRSGEMTSSASRLVLAQAKPEVNGWSGSPRTCATCPFSTLTSSEHESGQSCAQTTRIVCILVPSSDMLSVRLNPSRGTILPSRVWQRGTICQRKLEWASSCLVMTYYQAKLAVYFGESRDEWTSGAGHGGRPGDRARGGA